MDHQVQEFGDLRLKLMGLSTTGIAVHFLPPAKCDFDRSWI